MSTEKGIEEIVTNDHRQLSRNVKVPPITTALIIKIGLGAAASRGRSQNVVRLSMDGIIELTEMNGGPVNTQISKYVADKPRDRTAMGRFQGRRSDSSTFKPTDMSLRCNTLCRLVYQLDEGLAWYFSRNYDPFTKDIKDYEVDHIVNPQLIKPDGNFCSPGEEGASIDGCNFATMVFNPKALNNSNDFVARFNLHVELLEKPGDFSGPYIPLIIDPDVRFPGGDGP